jgi:WD40 repeat protein
VSSATSSFYVTGGTLRHDAPSYVERQADHDLLEGLRRGEFCYVLTSRQMGKSSLMVRAAARLREEGTHVVVLDLTAVGQNLTPEQWYDGLLVRIGRQLDLEEELEEHWQGHLRLSPVQRLFATIRDVALVRRPGPHVVFIDEIDIVRSLPFSTDEFFAAIRECYNRRTEDAEMGRITFCLLGVATPSDLVRDTRITPFNIGRRIELLDFPPSEAKALTAGLASAAPDALPPQDVLARMLFWTHGHPYLTQRLCLAAEQLNEQPHKALRNPAEVDLLCEELFFGERARERDDNLLFVRGRLLRADVERAGLLHLYEEVLMGRRVRDDERDPLVSVLRLAGIVRLEEGWLVSRNRIYKRVFDRAWVRAQMPDAELARQRAAFYRGVIRTTAIAAVVVAAITITVLIAVKQAASQAQAHFSQAQVTRKSGLAGQRIESIQALRAARSHFANEAILRDEVIACLALVDLGETTNGLVKLHRNTVGELSADLEVSAEAGDDGSITVRRLRDGQALASLPGFDQPVERLRFDPMGSFLAVEYRGISQTQIVVWNWRAKRQLFTRPYGVSGEALDFSGDGRRLAVGGPEGKVEVFALPEGELQCTLELKLDSREPRPPQALRLSPSGDLLAVSSTDDQYVELWDLGTRKRIAPLYHVGLVRDLAWHPGGQLLAAACEDSGVYLWQTNDYQKARKLAGHEGAVTAVAFNPQGTLLASLGEDETVRLWILSTERQLSGTLGRERFDRLGFTTNSRQLMASGRQPPKTRVWEVYGGELTVLKARTGAEKSLRTIDFSPNSRYLLAASASRCTIWETSSGQELGTIPLPNARAAWFAADGRHVVASSDSGLSKVRVFQQGPANPERFLAGVPLLLHRVPAEQGTPERLEWEEKAHAGGRAKPLDELGMMAMSLDRRTAAVVRQEAVLLVPLEAPDASGVKTNYLGTHYPLMALHPQGAWLASRAGDSNVLDLWCLSDAALRLAPTNVPGSTYFAFSPDGQWLATCWTGELQLYRVGAWEKPASVVPRMFASDQHAPVTFSQDGRTVAVAASRYSVQLRKLPESGRGETSLIATLESPDRFPLEILAFSPDGRHLAAATDSQIVLLWDLAALGEGLASLGLRGDWPGTP